MSLIKQNVQNGQNVTINFMSFISSEFIDTFVPILFVNVDDTKSITNIISSHVIPEV